ncbi:AcaB family transcriptional regulator [Xenorhabdus sp. KJ12.1]|uniref:AcaB family transcriptional regulator n=1 Tax=Xenorhabdus sp. KJ12.1 TaxID=1851571 RepID=UPI000C054531|nr:AcaB family transcriptional regulator [Xenorhabdus sp. KJ12.1]PHM72198.1 hypothetical protein Xekj_00476 [Xenorhabdus sp. KJ12.1]
MTEAQRKPNNTNNENIKKSARRVRNVERERTPFSNPEVEHKFTLKTQEAIRLYTRHFNNTSQALFNIMINTTRLERLGQRGISASTKKAIDAAFDIPMKEINVGVDALSQMIANAGDVADVKYTHPREFETATRTPEATRLIQLFKRYDLMVTMLDQAYLNALAPADEVEDTKLRLSTNIQNLSKTIKTHAQSSVEKLDKMTGTEIADTGNQVATEEKNLKMVEDDLAQSDELITEKNEA